jgi:beta-lactamase class C
MLSSSKRLPESRRSRPKKAFTMTKPTAIALLCACVLLPVHGRAATQKRADVGAVVAQSIRPLMQRYGVPGMAVGIVIQGRTYVYNFGVASKATRKPVVGSTFFEIGSVSKTFTATLAAYAQVTGKLSLSDVASKYLPPLRGSSFDKVSLLNLATHTSGGLPLQLPSNITNDAQLMAYFQHWKPTYAPGSYRVYSNPSIGMLGMITAKSMNAGFVTLMKTQLLQELGMNHTYLNVPKTQMENYAQGYTKKDLPIRMASGVLGSEAYGVRTTAGDLLRFVRANLHELALDETLQRAIIATHTGYYRVGAMTQDLIWEQYRYPVTLEHLLDGNSAKILFEANPVVALDPPLQPQNDALLDKTGSTNGFSAYVAFVPAQKIGIVFLANKNFPIPAQVKAAYQILTKLARNPM